MANVTSVQIGRMAISHVAARTSIQNFSENKTAAFHCEMWYDVALGQTLEAFDWNFARHQVTLAEHADDPPSDWLFRYIYPTNCLALRKIPNPAGKDAPSLPYEIRLNDAGSAKTICTNVEGAAAQVLYTRAITDPGLFSNYFVITLSYLLGHYIAMPLTRKDKIAADLLQMWAQAINTAPAMNANEQMESLPQDASWIQARGFVTPENCNRW